MWGGLANDAQELWRSSDVYGGREGSVWLCVNIAISCNNDLNLFSSLSEWILP